MTIEVVGDSPDSRLPNDVSTIRGLGAIANDPEVTLGDSEMTTPDSHTDIEPTLAVPELTPFANRYLDFLAQEGIDCYTLQHSQRPQLAELTRTYVMTVIEQHNHRFRQANLDSEQDKTSSRPTQVAAAKRLERYYAEHASSMNGTEDETLRQFRVSWVENNAKIARSYVKICKDLFLMEGLRWETTQHYPGPLADAITELMASYGEGRDYFRFG